MNADLRISVQDNSRNKNLKVLLVRVPFSPRQFFVRMNGQTWQKDGRPASLTKVFTALRKALVKAWEWFIAQSIVHSTELATAPQGTCWLQRVQTALTLACFAQSIKAIFLR